MITNMRALQLLLVAVTLLCGGCSYNNNSILYVTAAGRHVAFQTTTTTTTTQSKRGLVSKGGPKQHQQYQGKYDTITTIPISSTTFQHQKIIQRKSTTTSTSLNMFMGSDGGLLGIGGPEVVRIY
jgi:hypothetical protein